MKLRSRSKTSKVKGVKSTRASGKASVVKTSRNKIPIVKNLRKKKVSLGQKQPKRISHKQNLPQTSKIRHKSKKKSELKKTEEEKDSCRPCKHDTDAAKLTKWSDVTILELLEILKEERKHHKNVDEEEICPICRCELYDDIFKLSLKKIKEINKKQLGDPSSIDVVKFKDCLNHFYHKGCTDFMVQYAEQDGNSSKKKTKKKVKKKAQYLKCAVCSLIYGEFIGNCPPGTMSWELYKKGQYPCEGYEKTGTYIINYTFKDGFRNGVSYGGTYRQAYIPDTKEGREVLYLLIKSFKRKVSFTIGDSVTTGCKNVVVWNSIHHKTCTHGGIMTYGYPDATYFNRVKLEMADKGILLEQGEDPDNVSKKGSITIR
ncbi:unnamed protein product [Moneuplotes crassus]|uniref:RING-type E3 ubiquitin transferase n=1 Tax=Euplotes crassus TaxID=5936 RepID=A0AAD1XI19_EUPCR|nr:unnamed protein product [Moneuplotes crassus]